MASTDTSESGRSHEERNRNEQAKREMVCSKEEPVGYWSWLLRVFAFVRNGKKNECRVQVHRWEAGYVRDV